MRWKSAPALALVNLDSQRNQVWEIGEQRLVRLAIRTPRWCTLPPCVWSRNPIRDTSCCCHPLTGVP